MFLLCEMQSVAGGLPLRGLAWWWTQLLWMAGAASVAPIMLASPSAPRWAAFFLFLENLCSARHWRRRASYV